MEFTPRELQMLQLIPTGKTGKEITQSLHKPSIRYYQYYTQRIYKKLNVHNRMAAINKARALKLIL
jgi:DNA-binding NarL/FixJ family response regulator